MNTLILLVLLTQGSEPNAVEDTSETEESAQRPVISEGRLEWYLAEVADQVEEEEPTACEKQYGGAGRDDRELRNHVETVEFTRRGKHSFDRCVFDLNIPDEVNEAYETALAEDEERRPSKRLGERAVWKAVVARFSKTLRCPSGTQTGWGDKLGTQTEALHCWRDVPSLCRPGWVLESGFPGKCIRRSCPLGYLDLGKRAMPEAACYRCAVGKVDFKETDAYRASAFTSSGGDANPTSVLCVTPKGRARK